MKARIARMMPQLNEKQKRLFLASEAKSYGRGGISLVSRLSGVSRTTITTGMKELENGVVGDKKRVRREGGGRHYIEDNIPGVQDKIREISGQNHLPKYFFSGKGNAKQW